MSNEDRLRSLLSDLGKATLRGVKKCPKCGTYNGSRGLCCKNKYCDVVFKEPGERRKLSTEACKLITGSSVQVFSVRVRDKGPDWRGFVQLPANATVSNDSLASPASGLCFVDNCEKNFDANVLKCHEKCSSDTSIPACQHIQAALRCYAEAQPLTVKNSILRSMNVSNDLQQEIWILATETSGPLVQRVSKNIMAVKCKVTPKHPIGYLHLSFYTTKVKEKIEHKYCCSCSPLKPNSRISEGKHQSDLVQNQKRCVHFYSCICAFASDVKLADEFEYYINIDDNDLRMQQTLNPSLPVDETDQIVTMDFDCLTEDPHLLIFRDDTLTVQNFDGERLDIDYINLDAAILSSNMVEEIDGNCQRTLVEENNVINEVHNLEDGKETLVNTQTVEIIDSQLDIDQKYNINNDCEYLLDEQNSKLVNNRYTAKIFDSQTLFSTNNIKILEDAPIIDYSRIKVINENIHIQKYDQTMTQVENFKTSTGKRKRDDEKLGLPYLNLNNLNLVETKKAKTKPSIIKKHNYLNENVEETDVTLSFTKWLASVTERINQTMHFQFDGKPEPLVFHVPQMFFDCLRERISCGGKKKRLPNSTTAFVRKNGIPLGTFTKYTWQITNILHVKSIFETSLIPLEITRSFIQNSDSTYELYKRQETDIDRYKKTENSALIKPLELKTYLKVGKTSPNQVEPTPFLIEWIPDILPISKIGELRIRFEFGHVNNEAPDRWRGKVALSRNC